MGARGSICWVIALVGCSTPPVDTGDLGFHVVGSQPEHGDQTVLEAVLPELRLSAPADTSVCGYDHFVLVAIDDQVHGEVAFYPEIELEFVDSGNKVLFNHEEPFPSGYAYAMMALETDNPCTDTNGVPLRAHGVEFYIP